MEVSPVRYTAFTFTLEVSPAQDERLCRHVGAARYAYNKALELHIEAMRVWRAFRQGFTDDAYRALPKEAIPPVPRSGFDLINAFNAFKRSAAAGTPEQPGLPWRNEVFQQVFEEACVDLGRGLDAWRKGRAGPRTGPKPRFPRFKKKATARWSFRIRSKGNAVQVGTEGAPRTVRLPGKVGGTFGVRESTRNLRRLLRKPGTKLRFATVTYANARWKLTVNLETGPLHRGRHVPADLEQPIVGIDRGLRCFAVVADEHGRELARIDPPRPLRARLRRLRRLSRALSRKAKGSRGRIRARRQLGRLHGHIRNIRHHALRELVSWLAKTHGHLVVETLSTRALMGTWLARSLADVGWALFELWLTTKVAWHGGTLTKAPPHFPSTQQCSQCQHRGPKVPLHQRTFRCGHCGFVADRDTNAAINLARYARSHSSASPGSLGRP